jgi:hypothetical protein
MTHVAPVLLDFESRSRAALDAMTRGECREIGVVLRKHSPACGTSYRGCTPDCEAAEADAADRDEELARLRELRDAVRAWTQDHTSHADQLLATAFDRAEREAEYALTVRDIARMHVERMSPNAATGGEKEK